MFDQPVQKSGDHFRQVAEFKHISLIIVGLGLYVVCVKAWAQLYFTLLKGKDMSKPLFIANDRHQQVASQLVVYNYPPKGR